MNSSSGFSPSALPTPRWHPFFRLLAAVAGALVFAVLISIVIGTAVSVAASLTGQNAATQTQKFLSENLLLLNLFLYPPILLWLWICRRFLDRRTFVSLGLRARNFAGQFFGGAICGVLAVALIFGILWISGNLQVRGWSLEAQSSGASAAILSLLGWALTMLCVGFFEEVSFRGYAFHNLNSWLGSRAANILQAAVFALIHLGNLAAQGQSTPDAKLAAILALPNIFLFGIFAAICYFKTGSLWFPIAFHATWNWAMGCVFSLPVSGLPIFHLFDVSVTGSTPISGGAFGPEASLLLTPILMALVFVASRASDSPQVVADLSSLKKTAPENFTAWETEMTPESPETETDDARENRFKTRMGTRREQLDDETRRTLQMLNAARREQEKATRENAAQSTPILPLEAAPAPLQTEITVPVTTPIEAKIEAAPQAGSTPDTPPAPPEVAPKPKPKPAPRW